MGLERLFTYRRSFWLAVLDVGIGLISIVAGALSCGLFYAPASPRLLLAVGVMLLIYLTTLTLFGCYSSLWRYAQAKEFFYCLLGSICAGSVFLLVERSLLHTGLPLSFYLISILSVSMGVLAVRLSYRYFRERSKISLKQRRADQTPAMIVGAGTACLMLLNELTARKNVEFSPVVLVDDDPTKQQHRVGGLRVEGTTEDIPRLCRKHGVELIIVAIPSADSRCRSRILSICSEAQVKVKLLPFLSDFYREEGSVVGKLRDMMPEELLGRREVSLDVEGLRSFYKDKTILITGGGGSIGSELCRQLAVCQPKRLLILDIYENNAYEIQQELLRAYGQDFAVEVLIASIGDQPKLGQIFTRYRPEVVFHAAAHKHVPLMESAPDQAVKNNILGTRNLLDSAIEHQVQRLILISTDKAVNPTSVMGSTKRVCERMIQSRAGKSTTVLSAVRFGNVLGSNGSVIPLFKKQISEGGPVTVTHPDILRYFMTIPEAASLVLTAGGMAKGGEIFILDMGEPVKIDDLARKMIRLAGLTPGRDIEIRYTGLRQGEKLYEELLSGEGNLATDNQKIFIQIPEAVDEQALEQGIMELDQAAQKGASEEIIVALQSLVPEYHRGSRWSTTVSDASVDDKLLVAVN